MSGNRVLPGMDPYATCYGGHQFGNWAGQLGDGRAINLGDVVNSARRALDHAAQRRRPDAVFAHGGRPRGAAVVDPGVPLQRGDVSSGRADDACAERGDDRRTGDARHAVRRTSCAGAGCGRVPRRPFVHSFWAFRDPRCARRDRSAAALRQFHDSYQLSGIGRSGHGLGIDLSRVVCRGIAPHGCDDRRMDARRLRARRDEHRQHVDAGPDDRLRPVRVAGELRSRLDAEHDGRRSSPISVRSTTRNRAVEPVAARQCDLSVDRQSRAAGRHTARVCVDVTPNNGSR